MHGFVYLQMLVCETFSVPMPGIITEIHGRCILERMTSPWYNILIYDIIISQDNSHASGQSLPNLLFCSILIKAKCT